MQTLSPTTRTPHVKYSGPSPLGRALMTHADQFESIAVSWLSAGATCFAVYEHGRPLMQWPRFPKASVSSLRVPIRVGGTAVGELRVATMSDHAAHARLAADAVLVAALLALEDEIQHISAEFRRQQDQLVSAYELTNALSGHTTIESALRSLCFETARVLNADGGFAVFLPVSGPPTLTQYPDAAVKDHTLWSLFWEIHADTRSFLLPNGSLLDHALGEIRHLLAVPVMLRGSLRGALGVLNTTSTAFTANDVALAQALVQQASAHLENILLYQEIFERARLQAELDLARRVQSSLFPQQLPQVRGLDIFATSRPAFQVGGDFYTLAARPARPFVFAVGDISGKGLSAALLMTMTRTAIHSKASFMPKPMPDAVMRQSHEDLYDDFAQVGSFATVLVGLYQPERQQIVYANAGHSPVIYRPHDGTSRLLKADSTALGILPTSTAQTHTLPLQPGDIMVIATDGMTDARNSQGDTFGDARLLELVNALAERSANDIGTELLSAVELFESGMRQEDDQTLLVLKGEDV